MAIGPAGRTNAALLAVAILGAGRPELRQALARFRRERAEEVRATELADTAVTSRDARSPTRAGRSCPARPSASSAAASWAACSLGRPPAWATGWRSTPTTAPPATPAGQVADTTSSPLTTTRRWCRSSPAGVAAVTVEFENVPVSPAGGRRGHGQTPPRPRHGQGRAGEGIAVRPGPACWRSPSTGPGRSGSSPRPAWPPCPGRTSPSAGRRPSRLPRRPVPRPPRSATTARASGASTARGDLAGLLAELRRRRGVVEERVDAGGRVLGAGGPRPRRRAGHLSGDREPPPRRHPRLVGGPGPAAAGGDRGGRAAARRMAEALDLVGVACLECFVTGRTRRRSLANELAPRPHNSGHLTIEAAGTSQFEQQLRAVCGLPLGGTALHRPAAMANLLGDLWSGGEPDWAAALAVPGVSLHLYGKAEARPGRKMGHLTAVADDQPSAWHLERALAARSRPGRSGGAAAGVNPPDSPRREPVESSPSAPRARPSPASRSSPCTPCSTGARRRPASSPATGAPPTCTRAMGLVSQVFTEENLAPMTGHLAIGHTRYSTTGSQRLRNAQPHVIETMDGPLALAHNGNLINAPQLRRELLERGVGLSSSSDSEVMLHLLAGAGGPGVDWLTRIRVLMARAEGAYTLVLLTREGVYGVRDPWGLRPLALGELEGGGFCLASESCAFATDRCPHGAGDRCWRGRPHRRRGPLPGPPGRGAPTARLLHVRADLLRPARLGARRAPGAPHPSGPGAPAGPGGAPARTPTWSSPCPTRAPPTPSATPRRRASPSPRASSRAATSGGRSSSPPPPCARPAWP